MATLTEDVVLSRSRAKSLASVKKLNCWGTGLSDISILRKMPNVEVVTLSQPQNVRISNVVYFIIKFCLHVTHCCIAAKEYHTATCTKLKELYLRRNTVADLEEIQFLKNLPCLKVLWLSDNPCSESPNYRSTILRNLPNIEKLDNIELEIISHALSLRADVWFVPSLSAVGLYFTSEMDGMFSWNGSMFMVPQLNTSYALEVSSDEIDEAATSGEDYLVPEDYPVCNDASLEVRVEHGSGIVGLSTDEDTGTRAHMRSESSTNELLDETNKLRTQLGLKPLVFEESTIDNMSSSARVLVSSTENESNADTKNSNVLSAVLLLLNDLDGDQLRTIEKEIVRKLEIMEGNSELERDKEEREALTS